MSTFAERLTRGAIVGNLYGIPASYYAETSHLLSTPDAIKLYVALLAVGLVSGLVSKGIRRG